MGEAYPILSTASWLTGNCHMAREFPKATNPRLRNQSPFTFYCHWADTTLNRGGGQQGRRYRHTCTLTLSRTRPQSTDVLFYNAKRNRQAAASSFAACLGGVRGLEDTSHRRVGYTAPIVLELDGELGFIPCASDDKQPTRRVEVRSCFDWIAWQALMIKFMNTWFNCASKHSSTGFARSSQRISAVLAYGSVALLIQ